MLFESRFNNAVDMPEPFSGPAYQNSQARSIYNEHRVVNPMHGPLLKAALRYMRMLKDGDYIGIGVQGDRIIGEYLVTGGRWYLGYFNKNSGKFMASDFEELTKTAGEYSISDDNGELLFFILMPLLLENREFRERFHELMEQYPDFNDSQKCADHAQILCDNAKCRMELPVEDRILTDISFEKVQSISGLAIRNGTYIPTSIIGGSFEILVQHLPFDSPAVFTAQSFQGYFKCGSRTLSKNERDQVPVLADWFQVPKEAISICKHFKELENYPRNVIIRGPSGIGKSGISKAVAAGLDLPYNFMTFGANADETNVLGSYIPLNHQKKNRDYPTFKEITIDPPSAYYKLTGSLNYHITTEDVLEEMLRLSYEDGLASGNEKAHFIFKESPLIEALRYGYVVELQEASVIRQPGILVALNGIMDDTKKIHLENGETIERHPDTVVIYTTNVDYAGCNPMNQSVLSRCNLKFSMPQLTEDEMVKRAKAFTRCSEDFVPTIQKLAPIVKTIQKHCKEQDITEGVCGYPQYLDWVQSTLITKDPYYSAGVTIVPSVSEDMEVQQNIFSTCINNKIDEYEQ